MPKKIFELAKELDQNSLDLVEKLKGMGFSVRNHMSSLTDEELEMDAKMMRLENEDKKEDAQRHMAWFALFGMLLYPALVVTSVFTGLDKAAGVLGDMAPTYFVSVAAIVAAFFGKEAYVKSKNAEVSTKK